MVVEDFGNPSFLRELSQRIPIIYNESVSRTYNEDLIDEAFHTYHFGQERYTLSQSLFLSVARESGLEARIQRCETNGFPIAVVSVGRFDFTLHHGQTRSEINCINTSLIRRQHSAINNELIQPSLFKTPTFADDKLSEAENIYANIIEGCGGNGVSFNEYGFLRIAFPCLKIKNGKESFVFVENYDLYEVLRVLIENERRDEESKPLVDVAIPTIKKTKLS
jgi:hypothetical protein